MPIVVDTAATVAGLQALAQRYAVEGAVAVHEGAKLIADQAHSNLTAWGEHPRGTPTPSPPDTPPAMIDGHLSRSLQPGGIVMTGAGAEEEVGPQGVVYARVQELGGRVGRGNYIPARPYLKPAFEHRKEDIYALFLKAWS